MVFQKQKGLRSCEQLLRLDFLGTGTKQLESRRAVVVQCQKHVFNGINDFMNQKYSPIEVMIASVLGVLLIQWVWKAFQKATGTHSVPFTRVMIMMIADLPIIRGIVRREEAKVISKLRRDIMASRQGKQVETFVRLPEKGKHQKNDILRLLDARRRILGDDPASDSKHVSMKSKASGAIYVGDSRLLEIMNAVYAQFSLSNPMHSDMFPTTRQMEAEIVQMTAGLVGGYDTSLELCGSMTSGGTESILTAVKASRDYMRAHKNIRDPEMIVGPSAHAAFIKAAEYFKIKLVKAPLDSNTHCLTARAVKRYISKNTILVVASAPGYPHGVLDEVAEIGALCQKYDILLHVDACLGGFVLPFLKYLPPGAERPATLPVFDFASVPGVTSMSLDTHKFGCSHKGTSVVLYRSPDIRRYQYTSITDWSGGLYISPGFAGSRNGALIATAWTSMLYHGVEGYVENTKRMMRCATILKESIRDEIYELEVVGNPIMSVIAFSSSVVDIYVVNDILSSKGWKMSALQSPPALHMCFTPAHSEDITRQLVADLKDSVLQALTKEKSDQGMAPLYGMAAKVPDRRIVSNFLVAYQDMLLEP